MGSSISWHIEKHTRNEVNGLQIHNERLSNNHSNTKIDPTRTDQNRYLKSIGEKFSDQPYTTRIDNELINRYQGKRSPRKDAIVDVEHTIQFSGDVIDKLTQDERQAVMLTASTFIINKFGGMDNVIDWNLHRDETNDHIHIDTLPLTKDGRLSAKDMYSRSVLQIVQNELLEHMQLEYPDLDFKRASELERGFSNGKTQKDYERLKNVSDENKQLKKENENLQLDIKQLLIEEIVDIDPDRYTNEDTYHHFHKSLISDDFSEEQFIDLYGPNKTPWKTEQGKNQLMDWFSTTQLHEYLIRARDRTKQWLTTQKEKYQQQEAQINKLFSGIRQTVANVAYQFKNNDTYLDLTDPFMIEAIDTGKASVNPLGARFEDNQIRNEMLENGDFEHALKVSINENLADISIALGIPKKMRPQLIRDGGFFGTEETGHKFAYPFNKLIPQLIEDATNSRVEKAQELARQQNHSQNNNLNRGGRSR